MRIIGNAPVDGEVRAVASGALANGDTVVVNSDGTVSTITGVSQASGTPTELHNDYSDENAATFDSNSNKVVVFFKVSSGYPTAKVGTVGSLTTSFGSPVTVKSAHSYIDLSAAVFDSDSNKVVFAYQDEGNSNYGTAVVGTVSGTSISFGSGQVFNSANTYEPYVVFDTNSNKIVIAYRDGGNSNHGTAIVGTVSGTSITFGTSVKFEESTVENPSAVFDSSSNKICIFFDNGGDNNLQAAIGTVSGTSISFDGIPVVISTDSPNDKGIAPAFDSSSNQINVAFANATENDTYNVVFRNGSTNLTSENFIGFADGAYADTQSAVINSTCSVDRNQSGLTAGQKYYIQVDGSLGTTAADPSVEAGTAISATEILVKG